MVKAVVGANWGDEGKGKFTDMLAADADIVIRFQGGANAGHTIVNDYGKFALHTMPSGVFHSDIMNIIGNGVAFDIEKFMAELDSILSRDVPMPKLMTTSNYWLLLEDTFAGVWSGDNASKRLQQLCRQLNYQLTGEDKEVDYIVLPQEEEEVEYLDEEALKREAQGTEEE